MVHAVTSDDGVCTVHAVTSDDGVWTPHAVTRNNGIRSVCLEIVRILWDRLDAAAIDFVGHGYESTMSPEQALEP